MPCMYAYGFGPEPVPNQEQNFLCAVSKHFYATKSGELRKQKKALDPRLPGDKTLLTRMLAYDPQTGVLYGELHEHGEEDLLAFFARAWISKAEGKLRGIPRRLNVSRAVMANKSYKEDIDFLMAIAGFELGALPSGFKAGASAARLFEDVVDRCRFSRRGAMTLYQMQALSGFISDAACRGSSFEADALWASVVDAPARFFEQIDGEYEPTGAWRLAPWDWVLSGAPGAPSKPSKTA